MRFFALLLALFFMTAPIFSLEKDELAFRITSLFYKCELELRIYHDQPEHLWHTIGKMEAYDEILQLLEEE